MSKCIYSVSAFFVRPHKDSCGECLYFEDKDEAWKTYLEWKDKTKKYKDVHFDKFEED